ncbi:tRNA (adenosine(37)-N6)-threonylcarbamoyltransferase complex ATPase subunit type 1 TsaE [Paenibacillus rhizovicinus]|uniref:tRNA threonylcarbamoyladenosine biosynthesis protein TsaE n=1 Tax=Paenibacillus rhizovicinus TaxID=2704463 RepID=A0A6C0P3U3_9BACL|nr:tRNA (adenosine(37)-N6)-threonylcarbamoyltransferase complex ATPase subunit type 1 TsaE [Paenibacillus rhizovicinus]QHW33011.1 tRNA (adenosine(37)-N6)-threonylcarbamoyltransferase complex ATPase subunit type 1 TsaE [Paenibacillus rhizovicinus]
MSETIEIVWDVEEEFGTVLLAETLAGWAGPGTVLALDGDLGAGKTRFSQAFAKGIGVPGIVNSPTFTIIKEYKGAQLPLYHMDVYRLSEPEADELGLDDYFFGDGVTIVEWASLIEPLLPPDRLQMYMAHLGGEARRITITGIGSPYAAWCRQLQGMGAR